MRACPECGNIVEGRADKRYCNERCRKRAENQRLAPAVATVACTFCGELTTKPRRMLNSRRPFCSYLCRDLWRIDNQICMPPTSQPQSCPLPWDHPARSGQSTAVVYGHCSTCGAAHCSPAHSPRTYCSPACRRKAQNQRRPRKATVRAAKRTVIFQRDDWICWLCQEPTDPTATVPHPLAPTIDHLTPRVDGGTDDPDNLATAHFSCNSRRGRSLTRLTLNPPHAA